MHKDTQKIYAQVSRKVLFFFLIFVIKFNNVQKSKNSTCRHSAIGFNSLHRRFCRLALYEHCARFDHRRLSLNPDFFNLRYVKRLKTSFPDCIILFFLMATALPKPTASVMSDVL